MVLFNPGIDVINQRRQLQWKATLIREVQRRQGLEGVIEVKRRDNAGNISFAETSKTTAASTSFYTSSVTRRNKIVNPHNFSYVINPTSLCSNVSLKYVIYVHSAPDNHKKRQMVRQTWGSRDMLIKFQMKMIFVMGMTDSNTTMDLLRMESDEYGDILVEDFHDSYRNLTYKAIAALKWISGFCDQTSYVIKSDDDILIDMHSLMNFMDSSTVQEYGDKNVIMCNQWLKMKVIRDKKSKWYVSKSDFPDDFFPPYCSGSAFVMTSDVVKSMYKMSLETEFFWVDDFYVTGLLVKKLGIKHKRLNECYMLNGKSAVEKLKADEEHRTLKFFHVGKLNLIYDLWSLLKERLNTTCTGCFSWKQEDLQKPKNSSKE